jgi:hypothetical protein
LYSLFVLCEAKMFTHLHVHSHYSLLDGASSPEELCQRAAELGYTSLALTDTNNLYGALSFTVAAREAGLRPIIGAQITQSLCPEINEPYAVVLARDTEGFSELCGLVSERSCKPLCKKPVATLRFLLPISFWPKLCLLPKQGERFTSNLLITLRAATREGCSRPAGPHPGPGFP